ncbi:MAG: ABC transporter permease [Halanaerobiales bacterium]|nr:ABC transporter permease [Halanaerobiales bacterium]
MKKSRVEKSFNPRLEALKKSWYKFSRNPLSLLGLSVIMVIFFLAIFATVLAPYPEDSGLSVNFTRTFQSPSRQHLAGTDEYGRDIFSRMLVGLRYSLAIGLLVLILAVPFGILLGLLAGYYKETWLETIVMRFTELFMSIPPLILAMVICTMFTNSYFFSSVGIAVAWWPWYTRLTYNLVISVSNELYVLYAKLSGINVLKIIFKEILPNIYPSILTKMSLDMGSIIIIASSMNFVGLGIQPPTPSLGAMVSNSISYLPEYWWLTVFPALLVILIVLGFNLLGDGLNDIMSVEGK